MSYVVPPPTEKQIEFIKAIEQVVGVSFDYENSNRKQASLYITKYVKRFKELQQAG